MPTLNWRNGRAVPGFKALAVLTISSTGPRVYLMPHKPRASLLPKYLTPNTWGNRTVSCTLSAAMDSESSPNCRERQTKTQSAGGQRQCFEAHPHPLNGNNYENVWLNHHHYESCCTQPRTAHFPSPMRFKSHQTLTATIAAWEWNRRPENYPIVYQLFCSKDKMWRPSEHGR